MTVACEPVGAGKTLVTITHHRLDGLTRALPEIAGGVHEGWSVALESLSTGLEK